MRYLYRTHHSQALGKLRDSGLFTYLPNQTQMGRTYSCFYPGNLWDDQKEGDLPDYRVYYTTQPRIGIEGRVVLRFKDDVFTVFPFAVRAAHVKDDLFYLSTNSLSQQVLVPQQIEILLPDGRWSMILN